ncbi:DUF3368 domain-containing protein [Marinibactrum halimedae]|uniref:DUF3368 domain-containing protein n=1 Tax=Marinibactrum halimedae TaxID=1444977 RepID=A0AA37T9L4_9GAMM|nr:DUF3368 domain-containing protein [Marinibactrum halimedae]MCD9460695.1 DUF3368 domain-containing protein [Marinibactrum halimedae]GLS25182.1 DUF3368 domain-containing protein [Marinibactrum halimedae]
MNQEGKIVVSDTTAITYFSRINALFILKSLFNQVYIPEAVYEELTRQGDHIPGAKEVKTLNWIVVEEVKNIDEITAKFRVELDPGESQAIGLALHKQADLLVIDERKGRSEAENLGLKITGMIGIFIKAKEKGVIDRIAPYLDQLRKTNFTMGPALYGRALQLAGEGQPKKVKNK